MSIKGDTLRHFLIGHPFLRTQCIIVMIAWDKLYTCIGVHLVMSAILLHDADARSIPARVPLPAIHGMTLVNIAAIVTDEPTDAQAVTVLQATSAVQTLHPRGEGTVGVRPTAVHTPQPLAELAGELWRAIAEADIGPAL